VLRKINKDRENLGFLNDYPHEVSYAQSTGPRRKKRIIHCKFPG